jgi:hypothetical protein
MAVAAALDWLFYCFSKSLHFAGSNDTYFTESYGPGFVDALKADRKSLYSWFIALWFYI